MEFKEIVAPSIRELFVQQVVGMILSGQLRPGDRLPTERELADDMKISKTTVHEGVRELHRLGFLDVTSRRGVSVADYAQTGTVDTLLAIMHYHGGQLDAKTCRSILQVRYYLEGPAFRGWRPAIRRRIWRSWRSCTGRRRRRPERAFTHSPRRCSAITARLPFSAATPSLR